MSEIEFVEYEGDTTYNPSTEYDTYPDCCDDDTSYEVIPYNIQWSG